MIARAFRFAYPGFMKLAPLSRLLTPIIAAMLWTFISISAIAFPSGDTLYEYDAAGRLTEYQKGLPFGVGCQAPSGPTRVILGYDALGQLVSANGKWGTGTFKYDSLGNIRQKKLGSRTVNMSYNSLNRLASYTDSGSGPNKSLSYDSRGNVTALGALSFVYDYADQPRAVSGSASGTYHYDGNLKRVKSVVNGRTTYNVYDAAGQLVHVDQRPGGGQSERRTDYITVSGMTVARVEAGIAYRFYHTDHLGSSAVGTASNGSVLWEEYNTPFGEVMSSTPYNDDMAGFTGHIKDKVTGLNYMQARYYDPVGARFLSIDPMTMMDADMNPGMFNRYAYSMNDPINMLDPFGECSKGASESETICATEDAVKDTVGMAVYNGIKAVANTLRGMQGKDPVQDVDMGGEEQFGHEAEANSLGEEVAAVASAVVEAGVDSRNPVKALKPFGKKKGKCCFVAGTLVETETGLRPIDEIDVGDRVLARNPLTGKTALKSVTDLISQNERVIWTVEVESKSGENETFETTDDHPWWVVDIDGSGSWKTTDVLRSGMSVTTADNQTLTIGNVTETENTDYTYNLTVADFETYFVGQQKILVHNCSDEGSDGYSGHVANPEGQSGSGSGNWNKHSDRRAGTRYGQKRNSKRGNKNKKYIKSPNPNKKK